MEHEVMYQRDVSTATCFRWGKHRNQDEGTEKTEKGFKH